MSDTPAHLATVITDRPHTNAPSRTRYRITLPCGCSWWEEYPDTAPPPTATRRCFWHDGVVVDTPPKPITAA